MDLIQRLIDLRQSGTGAVVSEAGYTELQERMHVPDAIEDWIFDRIEQWRNGRRERPLLIMLSGNAGDGKSDLIERLVRRLGDTSELNIIRDATHADSPTVDQTARLAEFFGPFADEAGAEAEPQVSLIAMNTGMALSFMKEVADGDYGVQFTTFERAVKRELGLVRPEHPVPDHEWDYEIVNLDRRSILPHGEGPALFSRMLDKLDPDNPDGILFEDGKRCVGCAAREWCFVRTNIDSLRVTEVRESLASLLWQATLGGDIHLSPRNVWDLLYQVTTGGAHYFEDVASPCDKIERLAAQGPAAAPEVHRRLIYNLLFEAPGGDEYPPRGPVIDALAAVDPVQRTGRNAHLTESAAYNDPASDATGLSEAALTIGAASGSDGAPDPCLDKLAAILSDSVSPDDETKQMLAHGVLRRARLLGSPSHVSEELVDPDLREYAALLDAYLQWAPGSEAPEEIHSFKNMLEVSIAKIFGASASGNTYFRQDTFSPASSFPVFAPVDLAQAVEPVPDDDLSRGSGWLAAINYRPRFVAVEIRSSDGAWRVRGDFALFRLFKRVISGYAASSVDLEAFFGLRFACERLGGWHPDLDEVAIRDLEHGRTYRLRERTQLGRTVLELIDVT